MILSSTLECEDEPFPLVISDFRSRTDARIKPPPDHLQEAHRCEDGGLSSAVSTPAVIFQR